MHSSPPVELKYRHRPDRIIRGGLDMSLKLYAEIPYKLVRKRSLGPVLSTPPPLPLIALSPDDEWEEFDTATQTGFGYALPYLPSLDEPEAHKHTDRGSIAVPPEVPRRARLLSDYMTNNEFFQSPRHGFGPETRLIYKRNKELESGPVAVIASVSRPEELIFGASFESGNLDRVYRVFGRRYAPSHELLMLRGSQSSSGSKYASKPSTEPTASSSGKSATSPQTSTMPFPFFVDVDSEYDLYADTDVNTHGHIQWYFFRVTIPSILLRQTRERGATSLRVRFNIRNMLKKASLYTDGMLPAIYIESPSMIKRGWHHAGTNVCYFKNTDTYRHRRTGKVRNYYTLSFVYEFPVQISSSPKVSASQNVLDDKPFVAYFAHCYPYTYTRLQRFMLSMQKDPERRNNFKRRVLCKTIAGNNCDLLTITDFSQDDENESTARRRTAIVITARVHPGESNSSFVMHGILDFLTGNSLEARFLRHHFIFKVVPMLNPDGVIHDSAVHKSHCQTAPSNHGRLELDIADQFNPSLRHFTPADLYAAGFKFCHALLPFSQVLALQRASNVVVPMSPKCSGTPTRSVADRGEVGDATRSSNDLDINEPPLPIKCFGLIPGATDTTSSSKIRLAPLQTPQLPVIPSGLEDPVSWVQPQRPSSPLLDPVSFTRTVENSDTFSFGLPSEFDQLFSGEDVSMLSLLDHDDLIREIEAALPDNYQDNPEEDGSVGSESDLSGDATEEEEEKQEHQKTPPKSSDVSPNIEVEPTKLVVPALTRNRPPRVTRHLSEPRL
ncbi:unnamed protein product [Phytophthora lilii]|uniref:Unnamed protein product n=1 Tax=Phytophthora lilii TaxID=2077276 RepID=A0A9W6TB00_9STRA|nr:unnamed protein product [Phytophthora lilii]